jgi:hypothetical protein
MPRRHRKMKGGFLDSLESTLNNWGSKIKQSTINTYNKTKNAVTGSNSSSEPVTLSTVGGRTRRNKRGGSFSANKSVTGLAANSASVSNFKTAQPHNVVGGKSRRRRKHKCSKSCKHMKH